MPVRKHVITNLSDFSVSFVPDVLIYVEDCKSKGGDFISCPGRKLKLYLTIFMALAIPVDYR